MTATTGNVLPETFPVVVLAAIAAIFTPSADLTRRLAPIGLTWAIARKQGLVRIETYRKQI